MKGKLSSLLGILAFLLGFIVASNEVAAAVRCEIQYGGGQVCIRTGELQINKKVCDPRRGSCDPASQGFTDRLVDNLGFTDHRFSPGEEVVFRLHIQNVGDATFGKVTVTDTLPKELEFVSGSVSFELTDLSPGETEERDIKARVVSADKLAKNLDCDVTNVAQAVSGDQRDQDMAKICVEKKPAPAEELPAAGAESWFVALASLAIGGYGVYLLRFSRR